MSWSSEERGRERVSSEYDDMLYTCMNFQRITLYIHMYEVSIEKIPDLYWDPPKESKM